MKRLWERQGLDKEIINERGIYERNKGNKRYIKEKEKLNTPSPYLHLLFLNLNLFFITSSLSLSL